MSVSGIGKVPAQVVQTVKPPAAPPPKPTVQTTKPAQTGGVNKTV